MATSFHTLVVLLCSLVLMSCSPDREANVNGSGSSSGGGPGALRISVIPKGTTHDFWKSVHAGAIKAEQEINAVAESNNLPKVTVIWKGPQKEDDRSQQIQVVQNFIASGVNGIVLAPLDDTALLPPVQASMKAKVPV
ncbi:MAG: substrate-binding domain-containing protein, partial [Planctomycetes bacterium]|nr:substrate-binding domain-containing protein [Planctomycetota bacterium]